MAYSLAGSKIRGAVAQITFDDFHRNSAQVIQYAVFGEEAVKNGGKLEHMFNANNLVTLSMFYF